MSEIKWSKQIFYPHLYQNNLRVEWMFSLDRPAMNKRSHVKYYEIFKTTGSANNLRTIEKFTIYHHLYRSLIDLSKKPLCIVKIRRS